MRGEEEHRVWLGALLLLGPAAGDLLLLGVSASETKERKPRSIQNETKERKPRSIFVDMMVGYLKSLGGRNEQEAVGCVDWRANPRLDDERATRVGEITSRSMIRGHGLRRRRGHRLSGLPRPLLLIHAGT